MSLPSFEQLFGGIPEVFAQAPGRVNLMGEHTDYNDGLVLPVAIPQRTRVELRRRPDTVVTAASANVPLENAGWTRSYRLGAECPGEGWLDYLQGVTSVLASDGHPLGGFEVRVVSDVPLGAGLSSSAALEVALLRGLRELFGLTYDDVALALLGQRVERDFVGAPVGVMDQMASSLADERNALFLDTQSLEWHRLRLSSAIELVVINSGVAHRHVGGGYAVRRAECREAVSQLGVTSLRELKSEDSARIEALPEKLSRRVRHVVSENERVERAAEAIRAGKLNLLGALFAASHRSMRDDYEVSVPEVDALVEIASAEPEVFGARLTGGGFGGSIVAIALSGTGAKVAQRILRKYGRRSQARPTALLPSLA